MSVYRRFLNEGLPSFVTTNALRRNRIFAWSDVCELLLKIVYDVRGDTGLLLLAFAVMRDHLHLIVVMPSLALDALSSLSRGASPDRTISCSGRLARSGRVAIMSGRSLAMLRWSVPSIT